MKKIVSIVVAVATVLCLGICSFAANNAKFGVTVVSENDKTAVVSIDYNGGASFNALDFEVKLSNKVKVEKCEKGAGFNNFMLSIQSNNTVLSFNPDSNPVKFGFAALDAFKIVKGKDLLVLTLKKNSAEKLTPNDVKLTVTNCAAIGSEKNTVTVAVSVTQLDGKGAETEKNEKTEKKSTTTVKSKSDTANEKTTSVASTLAESTDVAQSNSVSATAENNENETPKAADSSSVEEKQGTDRKKVIIVAAAAAALLLVIIAAVVFIAQKYKKESD